MEAGSLGRDGDSDRLVLASYNTPCDLPTLESSARPHRPASTMPVTSRFPTAWPSSARCAPMTAPSISSRAGQRSSVPEDQPRLISPTQATQPLPSIDLGCKHGIIRGTHHGSVLFRSETSEWAGGIRLAFYYGQYWDLWYRWPGIRKLLFLNWKVHRYVLAAWPAMLWCACAALRRHRRTDESASEGGE